MANPQDHFEAARHYQEYYDNAMREVGVRIPAPVLGQSTNKYRRETLHAMQHTILSKDHKLSQINFRELPSDALAVYEPMTLQACAAERVNPARVPPGEIVPRKVRNELGHVSMIKWIGGLDPKYGEQHSFIKDLTRAGRRVTAFMRPMDSIQTFSARREIA